MKLSDLDSKSLKLNVLLLQASSPKLMMFLQDKIKRKYNCKGSSVLDISTKAELKTKVKEVIGILPLDGERWYAQIDLDKLYDKDLVPLIKKSSTCVFFCTCSKYSTFKKFKDELKGYDGVCDFYINYMRRADFIYLYDAFVPESNRLTKQLLDYVIQSYSSDVEVLFDLFQALASGTEIKTRKDVSDICGIGGLSVESYIMSLVKPLSGSDKGLATVLRNRIKAGIELSEALGFSSFYNFMNKTLRCFCEIKMLCMSGAIYKTIRKLPDTFDEKSLVRYQRFVYRLKDIPMSKLVRIRQSMGSKTWSCELDVLQFIYKYYLFEARDTAKKMLTSKTN